MPAGAHPDKLYTVHFRPTTTVDIQIDFAMVALSDCPSISYVRPDCRRENVGSEDSINRETACLYSYQLSCLGPALPCPFQCVWLRRHAR